MVGWQSWASFPTLTPRTICPLGPGPGAARRVAGRGHRSGGVHTGWWGRMVTRQDSSGTGQQKISSPSAGASDAGPSPGCERLPLPFFFFSFFSFGLANPNRRVDVDVDTGVWL